MKNEQQLLYRTVKKIVSVNPQSGDELAKIKRQVSRETDEALPSNARLLAAYRTLLQRGDISKNDSVESLLVTRRVRTLSGVAPVTVLTKPFPCPGKCVYCPSEPNMPKSYLSNEPAAMRAVANKFDPYEQVKARLTALKENGHQPDKIDLIILGGTWSSYPKDYQREFIHQCYRAVNTFGGDMDTSIDLAESQKINEHARFRIIGICIETRPDHVSEAEVRRWREYGVTRVQLGAQHLDDEVQRVTKRGHNTETLIHATKMIKNAGFKLDYHIMQNLPGSTPEKDLWCVKEIVKNELFQPDQIKIYPTIVNEYAELYQWYKEGRYTPYDGETLSTLLIEIKKLIPYRIRINRVIRDFPGESIVAGNNITNLREVVQKRMEQLGMSCKCIRCRESKYAPVVWDNVNLFTDVYPASEGTEYFINYASGDRSKLYAFLRLRLPLNKNHDHFLEELRGAAIVRELHTVGKLVPVSMKSEGEPQHSGFGKRLMCEAERIAKENGFGKLAVISGVGVRAYYYKLGYRLEGTYVVKTL